MDNMSQRMAKGGPMDADEQSASVMMEQPTGGGGWKLDEVRIRPAENGGFIASCSKSRQEASGGDNIGNGPSNYQSKEYAFASMGELVGFLEQEFGAASPAEGATMGGGAAAGPPMSGY